MTVIHILHFLSPRIHIKLIFLFPVEKYNFDIEVLIVISFFIAHKNYTNCPKFDPAHLYWIVSPAKVAVWYLEIVNILIIDERARKKIDSCT